MKNIKGIYLIVSLMIYQVFERNQMMMVSKQHLGMWCLTQFSFENVEENFLSISRSKNETFWPDCWFLFPSKYILLNVRMSMNKHDKYFISFSFSSFNLPLLLPLLRLTSVYVTYKRNGSAGDRHWTKSDKGDYKKGFLRETSHKMCNGLSECHMKRGEGNLLSFTNHNMNQIDLVNCVSLK